MKTRIISTVIGLPMLLIVIICGNEILTITLLILSIIGLSEFYSAFKKQYKPINIIGYIFTIILYAYLYAVKYYSLGNEYFYIITTLIILILLTVMVLKYPQYTINDTMITFFGWVYVPILLSYILQIRNMEYGKWFVWFVFLSAWGSDTFAYFAGHLFGKNKLVPVLSPKKTIEGAVGGVIGGVVLCLVYGIVIKYFVNPEIEFLLLMCVAIGFIGASISIMGDLSASAIKRYVKIKDYGNIIPGHGGILDRFDSVLFTAPIVFFLINIMKTISI